MASFWEDIGLSQPANVPPVNQSQVEEVQRARGLVPLTNADMHPDALMPDPSLFAPTYDQRVAAYQAELERQERLRGTLGGTPAPGMLSPSDIGQAVAPDVGRAPSMSTFALPQSVGGG